MDEDLLPLADIAVELEVSPRQLYRWAEQTRDNGFPAPAETLGRYKLYSTEEVVRWVSLWQKVTKNMGRKNHG